MRCAVFSDTTIRVFWAAVRYHGPASNLGAFKRIMLWSPRWVYAKDSFEIFQKLVLILQANLLSITTTSWAQIKTIIKYIKNIYGDICL